MRINRAMPVRDTATTAVLADAEKAVDEIQHPFHDQNSQQLGVEGNSLNVVKGIYEKPTPNVLLMATG